MRRDIPQLFHTHSRQGSFLSAIKLSKPSGYCMYTSPVNGLECGPEGSRKLRFPDFMTTAQKGGKVVSLTHLPYLTPGNSPGTHFC